ncbi:MAG: T9SS type A sorting domain-containing protein [Sphingobacteriaceae bacterium]
MKKLITLLLTVFAFSNLYSQLPYLNASTGNAGEFPVDKDTNMYGFYNNTLFKVDKNQNVVWTKNYSNINFYGLLLSKTGSLFFFNQNVFGKMDLDGNPLWTKSIDGIDAIYSGTVSGTHTVNCNRILLDRNNELVISGSTSVGSTVSDNGFILKTDTNGNFKYLKMVGALYSPSTYFQVVNDSSGFYKLNRFGQGSPPMLSGSLATRIFNISYKEISDTLINYIPIFGNNYGDYLMGWSILKSKLNTDFYLYVSYRPGAIGNTLDVTIAKFNSSAKNLWTTRFDGGPGFPSLGATENYKGQLLCQFLFHINFPGSKIAVASIDTNGVTNGICKNTYIYSTWPIQMGSNRIQSLKNNSFFQEHIPQNSPLNPLTIMKINFNSSSSCISTVSCNYTSIQGSAPVSYTPFCKINPVTSYTISSITPSITVTTLTINTTNCTLNEVGLNENFLQKQTINLHPNPASNILKFDLANSAEVEEVHVLDVNGKTVKTLLNCKEISVSDIAPGIYFLQLKSDGQTYYSKFIKE